MRVHRNLHAARKGAPQWVETKGGVVEQYHADIDLRDVTTRVRPAGVTKCHATQVRSVCAYFDGTPTHTDWLEGAWKRVEFDPRSDRAFKTADGREFNYAEVARLLPDGRAYVLNPRWKRF